MDVERVDRELSELMRSHNLTDEVLDQECSKEHKFCIEKFISWRDVGPRLPRIEQRDIDNIDIEVKGGKEQAKSRRLLELWHERKADDATYRVVIRAMLSERKGTEAARVFDLLVPDIN